MPVVIWIFVAFRIFATVSLDHVSIPWTPSILLGDSNACTMQIKKSPLVQSVDRYNATANLQMSTDQLYSHFSVRILMD
jgi:hypothetical protein